MDYKKIEYFEGTKEIMIKNWVKYNPVDNENIFKRVTEELNEVKYDDFVNLYISTLDEELQDKLKGLRRGFIGATKGLPSNRIKSKEERIKNNDNIEWQDKEYFDLKFIDDSIDLVKITKEQYDKLTAKYNKVIVHKNIINLDSYIVNGKGKKYKDHYKVLITWCNKDVTAQPNKNYQTQTQGTIYPKCKIV